MRTYSNLADLLAALSGSFTRGSQASYVSAAGILSYAANDTPRFDYDAVTKLARGILLEPSASLLPMQSENFGDTSWAAVRTSKVTGQASPDGAATAVLVREDATAAATHNIQRTASYTSGVTYARSCYMRAGGRTWGLLQLPPGVFGSALRASFDLANGVVGTVSAGASSYMAPAGNGWWRCVIVATATATTTGATILGPGAGNNIAVYDGDGVSGVYAWGDQLEAGSYASSYTPTTTTTVVRSADALVIGALPFFNADAGTLYAEFECPFGAIPPGSGGNFVANFSDGTSANHILLWLNTADAGPRAQITVGGVNQAALADGVMVADTVVKVALAYAANDFSLVVNAGTPKTDNSGTVPAVSKLSLGNFGGRLRRFRYFPTRQSNDALVAMTA